MCSVCVAMHLGCRAVLDLHVPGASRWSFCGCSIAVTCFRVCLFDDLTLEGLRAYFNNAIEWGAELLPPIDGSKGITIKSFTFDSLDDELFEVKQ